MARSKARSQSTLTVAEIVRHLDSRAPSGTAESWDNVGLLAGDPSWKTSGAVVCIDLTEESLRLAKKKGYRLIINHHPCIFPKSKGLSRILGGPGAGKGGLVFEAIRQGIAVAAYHTNFDRCALEVAQAIGEGLGAIPRGRLVDRPHGSLLKLAVFVPTTHLEPVREALAAAGAGHIGDYDSCSFGVRGDGYFRGSDLTQPFLGKPGELEKAQEIRLETILPRGLEKPVLSALLKAHPYQEVAYDLYPVEQGPARAGMIKGLGYGFWGEFPRPKAFSEVLASVRKLFQPSGMVMTEPVPRASQKIRRIGFAAGKGSSVIDAAMAAECDLFITGETDYHEAIAVAEYRRDRPMTVIQLGHRESERFYVETMGSWIESMGLKAERLHWRTQRVLADRQFDLS